VAKNTKNKSIQAAQKYTAKGQHKKAVAEYEKILKEDPDDIRVRIKLADAYTKLKDTDRAVEALTQCAKQYEQQGFMQKAVAIYKQILGIAPDRVDVYLALASNYRQLRRLNDAAEQYQGALRVLDQRQDEPGKLAVIQQMLEMDPDNVVDRVRLSEAYAAAGRTREAAQILRDTLSVLARLSDAGQAAARKAYPLVAERYLYHKPDDAEIAKELAKVYLAAELPERALPKLKTVQRSSPLDVELLGAVAEAFDLLGQTHKAVIVYKEMARLYKKAGLDNERSEVLSRILALDPTDESARKALGQTTSEVSGTTIEFDASAKAPAPKAAAPPPVAPAPAAPPPPPASAGVVDDLIAAAAGRAPKPAASTKLGRPPMGQAASPPPKAPAPPKPAAPPPAPDALSFDDDDDDDVGFGDANAGEKTLVDNLFIPDDVLADVQAGLDWAQPEQAASPRDRQVREDMRELDFYLTNGLADEARVLLDELAAKYGDHPEIQRRREALSKL